MQIVDVNRALEYSYRWPSNDIETYHLLEFITSRGVTVGVGFSSREAFGQVRKRVVAFVNGHPEAEFTGADDYPTTGEVLGVIKKPQSQKHFHPWEALPTDYSGFQVTRYKDRITGPRAFNSLAIVANVSDFPTIIRHALIQARYAGRL